MFDQPQNLEDPKKELNNIKSNKLFERRNLREDTAAITARSAYEYVNYLGIDLEEMKGTSVLDIGSGGANRFANQVSDLGIKVVSFSPHLRHASSRDDLNYDNIQYKHSVAGRAQEMPFADNSFDYEVALYSVPLYLPDPEEIKLSINEVVRTLREGGKAYFYPISSSQKATIEFALEELRSRVTLSWIPFQTADLDFRLVLTKIDPIPRPRLSF
jgi:ubiquinone/menaquinone biosynthesis C-methylase UbiE